MLRTQPLAAGLDPRFTVLDEAAARRLATSAFDAALDAWTVEHGAPALDLAAAYAWDLELLIADAHAALRSRGATHPGSCSRRRRRRPTPRRSPPPRPRPRTRCASPRAASRVNQARRGAGGMHAADRGPGARRRSPPRWTPRSCRRGAKALEHDDCVGYREAWAAYRGACADHHARPALALLDTLLAAFGRRYAEAKRERAGVDFDDLELRVRDLLAGEPALRARWAERFALIMVDEFQDTNRLQLDILEALERDNLFAVGDESQSIYGFRHADVGIFRARRAALDAGAVRSLTVNFRSRTEILDVVNAAFAPRAGRRLHPARRRARARGAAAVRARPAGGAARRAARRRDRRAGRSARTSWGSRRSRRSPGAAPRPAPSPRACAPRSTRAGPSTTSSSSSARRARCGSTSRRSRSRA